MSEKKKSFAKVVGVLLALVGSMGGADAAGYAPDLDQVQQLGLGSVVLIAYLHFVWLPLVKGMDGKLDKALGQTTPQVEAVEDEPATRRAATSPGLQVVKPVQS